MREGASQAIVALAKESAMHRRGFTLVELLVVIAIIGVLVALLLPAIQAAREAARRTECVNKLRQLALACHTYHDAMRRLPSVGDAVDPNSPHKATGLSWLGQILPYQEQDNLRNLIDDSAPWHAPINEQAEQTPVSLFLCPTTGDQLSVFTSTPGNTSAFVENSPLRAHYVGIMGAKSAGDFRNAPYPDSGYTMMLNGGNIVGLGSGDVSGGLADNGAIVFNSKIQFKHFSDGTSNTMMLGESSWDSGPTRTWIVGTLDQNSGPGGAFHGWVYNSKNIRWPLNTAFREKPGERPSGYNSNDISLGSLHPGGAHLAMADGSARFQSDDAGLNVLRALATRNNAEVDSPESTVTGGGNTGGSGR
jgi:prepilin-type N-terminal cleavage/methylation domain-containing protein/prepilin-type processing-associated H-X9-DG protein